MKVTPRPPPGAPRPHDEAPLARRTALVAFAFFLASALSLAWDGVDLSTLQRAFPLYALGGFSVLIFGTSRLLIAGMAGRVPADYRRVVMIERTRFSNDDLLTGSSESSQCSAR